MAKKTSNVCDQLRAAAKASGLTTYRISKMSGITPAMLARFLSGERDIRGETFAKIAAALGLELQPKEKPCAK